MKNRSTRRTAFQAEMEQGDAMFKTLAVAATLATLFFVRTAPAQTSPETAPESLDVAVYWSPAKTISAEATERLLDSDEWTRYYLRTIERFDAARFQNRPDSPLKKRLETIFPDAPASLGGLLDVVFGSCRGVWLDLTLDPKTLGIASFSGVWVSDFNETTDLIVAALAEAGYVERFDVSGKSETPRRFVRADSDSEPESTLFLDALSPIAEGSPLSAVFLARSADVARARKTEFAANPRFASFLEPTEKSLATVQVGPSGLEKLERFYAERANDAESNDAKDASGDFDSLAVWAPGLAELARRLEDASVSFQDVGNAVEATVAFVAKDVETANDLQYLTEESKKAVAEWASKTQTTPAQALVAEILSGATVELVGKTGFAATYRIADPPIFDLMKRYFKSRTLETPNDGENARD